MITVAGEALMDLLREPTGSYSALPGGAAFNVARMVAALGGECRFLGRLSADGFGRQLQATLREAGVDVVVRASTEAPTTLALARVDQAGSAQYSFYLDGTSAAELQPGQIPDRLLESTELIAVGGLGIVAEPTASSLLELVRGAPRDTTVWLDPNCRPAAIRDVAAYRARVAEFLARADVVKVSVEDLAVLAPGQDPGEAARGLLALGPAAVLVTAGPAPVRVHTPAGEQSVAGHQVGVLDTIGAGDAFVAGWLTWWARRALTRADLGERDALLAGTRAAVRVAAAACTTRGATLPADLDPFCGR